MAEFSNQAAKASSFKVTKPRTNEDKSSEDTKQQPWKKLQSLEHLPKEIPWGKDDVDDEIYRVKHSEAGGSVDAGGLSDPKPMPQPPRPDYLGS